MTWPTLRVLSAGLGTQSCALALMSAAGDLPRLDHIVFADTHGEMPETYEYLDYLRSVVEPAGIPLHVVSAGSLEDALLGGATSSNPMPPAHLLDDDGRPSRVSNYRCSYDFKRRVVTREVKRLCGGRGAWKRTTVEQWIGFSMDELGRMKPAEQCRCGHNRTVRKGKKVELIHSEGGGCARCSCATFDPWLVNVWPLAMDLRMRRADTVAWFTRNGHPTPPRSACWFCPNSGNARWQRLRAHKPELWERACAIDEALRPPTWARVSLRSKELFLHGSMAPLREADLRTKAEVLADEGHEALWSEDVLAADCELGTCST